MSYATKTYWVDDDVVAEDGDARDPRRIEGRPGRRGRAHALTPAKATAGYRPRRTVPAVCGG